MTTGAVTGYCRVLSEAIGQAACTISSKLVNHAPCGLKRDDIVRLADRTIILFSAKAWSWLIQEVALWSYCIS